MGASDWIRGAGRLVAEVAGAVWPEPAPAPPIPMQTPIGPAVMPKLDRVEDLNMKVLSNTWHAFPDQPLPEDWTVDKVREARRLHDIGDFSASVRLRDVLTTDARVFAASGQRVATPSTLPWIAKASSFQNGLGRSEQVRLETTAMIGPEADCCPPHVARRIVFDMVWFGVSIAQLIWEPTPDGERWRFRVEAWPMQFARWNATLRAYQVQAQEGLVTVRHGDGKWLVFEPYGYRSWMNGAVRALAMAWTDRAYGIRYRSQYAAVHGSPVPVGTLPSRIPIKSPQGQAFQRFVQSIMLGRTGGVKPEGAEIEMLEATSTAGTGVFKDIVACSDADIAIALLGQDGTVSKGPVYTPPMLQGVRFDLVELDGRTLDVGFTSGALVPYTLINWGDKRLCSHVERTIPDPEEEQRDEAVARQHTAFAAVLTAYRAAGVTLEPDFVDYLAEEFRVRAPPVTEPDPVEPSAAGGSSTALDAPPASGPVEKSAAA